MIQVVVPSNDAIATTLLFCDWLPDMEVDHPGFAAPPESRNNGVGRVKLVSTSLFGREDFLVGEYREVVAVGGLWTNYGIVANVVCDLD